MPVWFGDYITLTCFLRNSPVYWFHNNKLIEREETANTYVMTGIQLDDLGYYTCGYNMFEGQSERLHIYSRGRKTLLLT